MDIDAGVLFERTRDDFLDYAYDFINEMFDEILLYYTENNLPFDPRRVARETWDMLRDGSYERP